MTKALESLRLLLAVYAIIYPVQLDHDISKVQTHANTFKQLCKQFTQAHQYLLIHCHRYQPLNPWVSTIHPNHLPTSPPPVQQALHPTQQA